MSDQSTDKAQGGSPNMTLSTTSKSPTQVGSPEWLDHGDASEDDNNGHVGRVKSEVRNPG